ncbi:hypothetical protein DV735_g3381, partial [Chaetothyriales sp. CBS 134920]
MAPAASDSKPMYGKDERALCFHGELLYEAKVLEIRKQDPKDRTSPFEYRVHYKGWKNTWDDWVLQDRLRKFTEDNKELAANLKRELIQQSQPKSAVKPIQSRNQKQGSDLGSGRGSEERHSSVPAGARGTKRGRDNDIEKASTPGTPPTRRVTRNTREKPVSELTLDELLAYSPPPSPEYISRSSARRRFVSWAPLLSGTTLAEKAKIEAELRKEAKAASPPSKARPASLKTQTEEPGKFSKHVFSDDLDSLSDASTHSLMDPYPWGLDPDPLELDPPGVGGPFDALKYPRRLVEQLNRDDGWTIAYWGPAALNKIPTKLMLRIKPAVLDQMPDQVINHQQATVRNRLLAYRFSAAFSPSSSSSSLSWLSRTPSPPWPTTPEEDETSVPRKRSSDGSPLRQSKRQAVASAGKPVPLMEPEPTPKPTSQQDEGRPSPPAQIPPSAISAEKAQADDRRACRQCMCTGRSCDGHSPEDNFVSRPSIRITIPDHLKNILVDDWENVTKSLLLVPLPSRAPANFIIDSYFDEEKLNRRLGTGDADILEEFCAGLKVYFDKSIGKILLYRFERGQLAEVRKLWESGRYPDWENRGPGDCYGAEHLTRMLVNMPELIAQTNMDTQSVARLKEELSKFCVWLSRNSHKYFAAKYEKPSADKGNRKKKQSE